MTWVGVLGAMTIAPALLHALGLHDFGPLLPTPSLLEETHLIEDLCAVVSLTTGLLTFVLMRRSWRWVPNLWGAGGMVALAAVLGGVNVGAIFAVQSLLAGDIADAIFDVLFGTFFGFFFLFGSAPGAAIGLVFVLLRSWTEWIRRRGALDQLDWITLAAGFWLVVAGAGALWLAPVDLEHPLGVTALLGGGPVSLLA